MKIAREVKKLALSFGALAAILLAALCTVPAHAGSSHTWVSRGGNDGNVDCPLTSPCATLTAALGQTVDGGVVNCLDSGPFGEYTIQVSVTIDCTGTVATPDGPGG
jgi:hypothetical protein